MEIPKLAFNYSDEKYEKTEPEELIELLFESTSKDGCLCIPSGYTYEDAYYNREGYFVCKMNWNRDDCDNLVKEFRKVYKNVRKIAELFQYDEENDIVFLPEDLDHDEANESVLNIYLKPFDTEEFDMDLIEDISDRMDTMTFLDAMKKSNFSAADLDEENKKQIIKHYIDITVSEDEKELYKLYRQSLEKQSENRLRNKMMAHDVIVTAMNICEMVYSEMPEESIKAEAKCFAQAMVLNRYCTEMVKISYEM